MPPMTSAGLDDAKVEGLVKDYEDKVMRLEVERAALKEGAVKIAPQAASVRPTTSSTSLDTDAIIATSLLMSFELKSKATTF